VLIADDHSVVREGLVSLIRRKPSRKRMKAWPVYGAVLVEGMIRKGDPVELLN
jgi:hypothetical protein